MGRARSPDRDKAFRIWEESNGAKKLKEIAAELNISEGTVRGWKNKDKWTEQFKQFNGTFQKKKRNAPKNRGTHDGKKHSPGVVGFEEIESAELTEKQRLFCLYYVKIFNATMAAIKAGYAKDSAHVQGPRLLGNVRVKKEIKRLKGSLTEELFIDALDVLKKWIQIAFADITDYVKFGQREVQAMGAFGPIYEGEGENKKPVMKTINYVDFNDSTMVDGTIIKEVKQGKDGVSIKFEDKLKALDKLSEYFDLFPDKFKQKIEEEKVKLSREKLELEKRKQDDPDEGHEDDGFMEALEGAVGEVWANEE